MYCEMQNKLLFKPIHDILPLASVWNKLCKTVYYWAGLDICAGDTSTSTELMSGAKSRKWVHQNQTTNQYALVS